MKGFLTFLAGVVIAVTLTGCITVTKYEKERIDQQLTGNRGYIFGKSEAVAQESKSRTRTVYEIEVELPFLE